MKPEHYIQRNWRLIFTSLALLLVLTVNHRALPAFAYAAPSPEHTSVQKGRDAHESEVKQKVSLEAVSSYTAQLAEPATLLPIAFTAPVQYSVQKKASVPYWTFHLQKLATLPISPNAP
ncbi:hypothetical protein [Rufibacter roseus]|uniref:DUF2547 family protein n=1 Tax=Rufibacter roseus TaxID=1567108 RepID=A0ABW2DPL6_9BACT|nr:hypothetical protein [Rufibacter roseus]